MKRVLLLLLLACVLSGAAFAQTVAKENQTLPYEYGRVVIHNFSEKAGLAPVVFDHWLHRAKFTCRLCHVDIGFAMKAGATGIKASDNRNGYYCGACHNGKTISDTKQVFESCGKLMISQDRANCFRCHSLGKKVKPEYDFNRFTKNFPKGRFGNGVDWEKAEEDRLIRPVGFLEGISIRRKSISDQKDLALGAKAEGKPDIVFGYTMETRQAFRATGVEGMPDIIFSHEKHFVWNGCELCHPEIFKGVKKGALKYTMVDIFEGKSCGVCHTTVAFPLLDCQRCHIKPVQ
jgi:c(7)-type cytochrome triheme protein